MNKKILIVEGNLKEENNNFSKNGIPTHTESLKESLSFFTNSLDLDVVNPSSDTNISSIIKDIKKYDGLIWGGSALNIYNDTIEIRRQIEFMKECFKNIKSILAICWGMQVAVTAAGGEVKKSNNGVHIGIAQNISVNENGIKFPLYKNKKNIFNSPAFNFDEVATTPKDSTILASNKVNKVQSLNFKTGTSEIWGLQYHPEITYDKMIRLIKFRKDRLINVRKVFINENEIEEHINLIEEENKISEKSSRLRELQNWLDYISAN
tara:strand:+ start:3094 stop:3888 length:795 start_codon:yes stop_codon:yes gene_type:complete